MFKCSRNFAKLKEKQKQKWCESDLRIRDQILKWIVISTADLNLLWNISALTVVLCFERLRVNVIGVHGKI